MENDCVFCKIVAKEIPAHILFEDEKTLAFLDINPMNSGHALIIPKTHASDVFEIAHEDWLAVMSTVHTLARAIERTLSPAGINIVMNNRSAAGQVVFHAHVHIVPRKVQDGHFKAAYKHSLSEAEAQDLESRIRAAL